TTETRRPDSSRSPVRWRRPGFQAGSRQQARNARARGSETGDAAAPVLIGLGEQVQARLDRRLQPKALVFGQVGGGKCDRVAVEAAQRAQPAMQVDCV